MNTNSKQNNASDISKQQQHATNSDATNSDENNNISITDMSNIAIAKTKQHKDLKPIQHIINMQILKEYEKNKMTSITSNKNNLKVPTDMLKKIYLTMIDINTAKTIAANVYKNDYAILVHHTIDPETLEQLNVI